MAASGTIWSADTVERVARACLKKALFIGGWGETVRGTGEECGERLLLPSSNGFERRFRVLGVRMARTFFSQSMTIRNSVSMVSVAQAASRRLSAGLHVGAASAISSRPRVCRLRPRIASDR